MLIWRKMMIWTRTSAFPCKLVVAKVMTDRKMIYDVINPYYDVIITKNLFHVISFTILSTCTEFHLKWIIKHIQLNPSSGSFTITQYFSFMLDNHVLYRNVSIKRIFAETILSVFFFALSDIPCERKIKFSKKWNSKKKLLIINRYSTRQYRISKFIQSRKVVLDDAQRSDLCNAYPIYCCVMSVMSNN